MARIACIILLLAFIAGGCSHRSYPSHWPERIAPGKGDCLDISGRYRTLSDPLPADSGPCKWSGGMRMVSGEASCVSLAEMFFYPVASEPTGSWMEIRQTDDRLTISYHLPEKDLQRFLSQQIPRREWHGKLTASGEGILAEELVRGQQYECTADGVSRIMTSKWENANIGAAKINRARTFRRAADGSLLLDAVDKEYGVFWLPPFALVTYSNRWMRWQPLEKTVNQPGSN
ncbi:MAG: hypothetical protein FIA91_08315 [Geobacter sp.]|nr:hypothetical protein [Geobacter sp.]